MNPNSDVDRNRLSKAMEYSGRRLASFRQLTRTMVEEYGGSGYGDSVSQNRITYLHLMNQVVDAYTMSLAANRPRILVSTTQNPLKFFAKKFAVATNNLIEEIVLEQTLRQAVLAAFFSVGIVKVHMADSAPVMLEQGLWMDPGTPFASCIALENFVYDTSATQWHEIKYAADNYRIPFDDLKDDMFDQSVARKLKPTSKYNHDDASERLEAISSGNETDVDEFEPMVDLTDVWIPRDNKIYTYPVGTAGRYSIGEKPVIVMDWNGPEFGPYHLLGFNNVPENIMPTSPASHLTGMSHLIENLTDKGAQRARAQRDVGTYTPAGAESATKMKTAGDSEWVAVNETGAVKIEKFGGVDPGNHAFELWAIEMFDRMAGNLQAKAGLGPQADTLGQEEMIYGAVSKKEAQMQYQVLDFTKGIVRDLGYMLWQDQVKQVPGQMTIDGLEDYPVDATWTPEMREGDFFDYNMDIDVFSMSYQSPSQRVKALLQLVKEVYIPLNDITMQQGGQLDIREMTADFADLLNLPRVKNWVKFTGALPEEGAQQGAGRSRMPAQTSREYIRRSVPTSGTAQGRAHVQQQAWLTQAGQNNPDQEAMLKR